MFAGAVVLASGATSEVARLFDGVARLRNVALLIRVDTAQAGQDLDGICS